MEYFDASYLGGKKYRDGGGNFRKRLESSRGFSLPQFGEYVGEKGDREFIYNLRCMSEEYLEKERELRKPRTLEDFM